MDYTSHIVLATISGGVGGFLVSLWLGDLFFWVVIGIAFAIASDSAIRTIIAVKGPEVDLSVTPFVERKPELPIQKPPTESI